MDIYVEEGAYKPVRAHPTDAGLDIRAMHDGVVRAGRTATFRTGVHIQLPRYPCHEVTAGLLMPRSGLMVNHDILSFGVVDHGYTGEIMVHLFNLGQKDYWVQAGDKISQLVVARVLCEPIRFTDSIEGGERQDDGFGSTGR